MLSNKILITGGCGFIGLSLVEQLVGKYPSLSIRIIDNFSHGSPDDLAEITDFQLSTAEQCGQHKGVVLIEGDIRNMDIAMMCTKDIKGIVHLAANTGVGPSVQDPWSDLESNVIGTFNMLEAARLNKVDKFVFASSGAPIGEVEPPIHEELAPHPVSPYGASKLAGEGYCSAYAHSYGLNTLSLRFGNVYGPRSKKKSSVVAKFIRQAMAGEICEIYGDGNQSRDFIYIGDIVNAIVLALDKESYGEVFQIATGQESTVLEVAKIIRNKLKYLANVEMKMHFISARAGDVRRNYSDTTKAKRILGWEHKTDLKLGISTTIEYFIKQSKKETSNIIN